MSEANQSARSSPERQNGLRPATRRRWVVLGVIFVLVVAAALVVPSYLTRSMMGPAPQTLSQFVAAAPNSAVDVALDVVADPSGDTLLGNLLERNPDATYRRTGHQVQIHWQPDTPIVMGKRDDVRPGAVIQVRGRVSGPDIVTADRIVILTGFANVQ